MPDLVTHVCSALLPKAITGGRHTGPFVLGAVLPDLLGRGPTILADLLRPFGMPTVMMVPWRVFHMPVGILGASVLLALCFREDDRPAVLGWLLGGAFLHLFLDLLQNHYGRGYLLFWPLSGVTWDLGLISAEATVPWAPWIALVTALAWAIRWWWDRRATLN